MRGPTIPTHKFTREEEEGEEAESDADEDLLAQIEEEENCPPTEKDIIDMNDAMVERQARLRKVAEVVAAALAEFPAVTRIVIFGSIAVPLWKEIPRFAQFRRARVAIWHECKDADLAVWLDETKTPALLRDLSKARSGSLQQLFLNTGVGISPHEIEVFLFDAQTGQHTGRLCYFARCPRGNKDCLKPGCGGKKFLKQVPEFKLKEHTLDPQRILLLYEKN